VTSCTTYKQQSIHTKIPPSNNSPRPVSYIIQCKYKNKKTPHIYKKEDKRNRNLQYACRLCRYTELAPDQPLIYRFDLKKEVGNILHTVPSAVSDDPTLARSQNANCTNCGHNEAVFFMSDTTQSDSLALIFVCCNCDHKWVN
jgi:DNA-directed RNA polymerase II subunit RPB9